MTRWPDPERLLIARYPRGPWPARATRTWYEQVLYGAQDVAARRELGETRWWPGCGRGPTVGRRRRCSTAHYRPVPRSPCANRGDPPQSRRPSLHREVQRQRCMPVCSSALWLHAIQNKPLPNCISPNRSAACWAIAWPSTLR